MTESATDSKSACVRDALVFRRSSIHAGEDARTVRRACREPAARVQQYAAAAARTCGASDLVEALQAVCRVADFSPLNSVEFQVVKSRNNNNTTIIPNQDS